MNTINRRKTQLSVAAVAALAIFALAAVMLLAGGFTTGTAQAQPDPNLNTGKYKDPQPCGINVNKVPDNPDGEFSGGHVALFDAYWDYNTQTLNNNLCPPLAEHTVVKRGRSISITTGRTKSNIDINETVFHAGNEFSHTITAADRQKYPFLPPVGTKVWWLKQDDPEAEAEEAAKRKAQGLGPAPEEPELVLGISAGLFKEEDWHLEGDAPLQYEFEAERDPEGNVLPFLVFANDATEPIWDSRKVDTAAIPIKPGQYKHYNWMFFPEADQSHTYILEVHLKGHVRTEPGPDAPDGWQPLTWPTGKDAPAYTPDERTDAFTETLDSIETVVSSEVRKQKYTIHVGPLHLNEQPRFGVLGEVQAGAAAGTTVGEPIPMYGTDRNQLHYTLEGDGHENFTVTETEGIHAGVNAQLVVADGAQLRYPDPDRPYYDLLLGVSDRHDHEDGSDQAIDNLIPVRIYVIASSGPYITVAFNNENPQARYEIQGIARVMGLPAGTTITEFTAYYSVVDPQRSFAQITNVGDKAVFRFYPEREATGTINVVLGAKYRLNGETKEVSSAVYPIIWRR